MVFHVCTKELLYLTQVYELVPSCGVREAYISQFARLLQRKALALIKYVGAEEYVKQVFMF